MRHLLKDFCRRSPEFFITGKQIPFSHESWKTTVVAVWGRHAMPTEKFLGTRAPWSQKFNQFLEFRAVNNSVVDRVGHTLGDHTRTGALPPKICKNLVQHHKFWKWSFNQIWNPQNLICLAKTPVIPQKCGNKYYFNNALFNWKS